MYLSVTVVFYTAVYTVEVQQFYIIFLECLTVIVVRGTQVPILIARVKVTAPGIYENQRILE